MQLYSESHLMYQTLDKSILCINVSNVAIVSIRPIKQWQTCEMASSDK